MKKYFLLILSALLLLSGCSSAKETATSTAQSEYVVESTSKETATTAESQASEHDAPTIDETLILDEKGIRITAKSIDYDDWFEPEIKLLIENDSDTDLTIQCRNASVNGYMVDTVFSCDVSSGKKRMTD